MVVINKNEVRPVDNLNSWSMIMPSANQKYCILTEYTKNEECTFKTSLKDDVGDDLLSDDRYLDSENTATRPAVDCIKNNT